MTMCKPLLIVCAAVCIALLIMTNVPTVEGFGLMTHKGCNQPKEVGLCLDNSRRYYYNSRKNRCIPFTYGGCGGNTNNFKSKRDCWQTCAGKKDECRNNRDCPKGKECQKTPRLMKCQRIKRIVIKPDVCSMPRHTGPCYASKLPRFYYDPAKGACSSFNFGGCGGNENNFKTMAECRRTCAAPTDVCTMPPVTGPCRANIPRFYYDPTEGACSSFTFGGCNGNENSFKTMAECRRTCADPISKPKPRCPPVCKLGCPNGNVLDKNGCRTCTCKPKPRCPPVCKIGCPNGNVMDNNGCPTCECKPRNQVCPMVRCSGPCPQGFTKDSRGCQTCSCKPLSRECPLVKCANRCRRGYEKDLRGCQTCECKPAECPVFRCRACPNGYEKDSNGCDTCRCKSRSCPTALCNFYCMVPQFFSARMRECGCNCGRQGRQLSRQ